MPRSTLLLMIVIPMAASALPAGITGYSGKGGTSVCSSCHTAGAAVPTVALTGPATLTAGMTGNYTLTITGGPAKGAGMNASLSGANSGSAVFTAGNGNKLSNGELIHTAPAAFVVNVATFTFAIKAPLTAGLFTISAAGLSTNNDLTIAGDGTGKATLDVNVSLTAGSPPATGAADGGGVAPVLPGSDAGMMMTPPVVAADGGTTPAPAPPAVTPDGGAAAPAAPAALIPTSTGGKAAPLSDGVVEGVGCSAIDGRSLFALLAMLAPLITRRKLR